MRTSLIILFLVLSFSVLGQVSISDAEYFWGVHDPGVGNAISISAADGSFDEVVEEIVNSGVNQPTSNGIILY